MFLTATNLLCTLFTGSLTRKNTENNFRSRLLASVKLRVKLGPSTRRRSCDLPVIHGSAALVAPIAGAQLVALAVANATICENSSSIRAFSCSSTDLSRWIPSGNDAGLESAHARDAVMLRM
jgi:hypothetical protein